MQANSSLHFPVGDLLHRVGARRDISAEANVDVALEAARVNGPVTVTGVLEAMVDGVVATVDVAVPIHLTCNRCLTEWDEPLPARFVHVFADDSTKRPARSSPTGRSTSSMWFTTRWRLHCQWSRCAGPIARDFAPCAEPT